MSNWDSPLSPGGKQRREQILQMAQAEARKRRLRRRGAGAGVVALVVISGTLIWNAIPQKPILIPSPQIVRTPTTLPAPSAITEPSTGIVIHYIQTDPTITDRLSVKSEQTWRVLDDDQLLSELATAGHPAGLIETPQRTYLVMRER